MLNELDRFIEHGGEKLSDTDEGLRGIEGLIGFSGRVGVFVLASFVPEKHNISSSPPAFEKNIFNKGIRNANGNGFESSLAMFWVFSEL
jgi:hypothetical protein